jgi:ABC-2 type transport system ATP-binding protein
MDKVMIEAVGLTKLFGSQAAVRELSFTAQQGDVVGLLGPNGSGKTTTIRLLTTVLPPTSGSFSVAGIPSTRPSEIRRRVGALPESSGYPGHQTGREYLRYHARLFGRSEPDAARIADQLLVEMGLAARGSARISTYSRGMRQRLGVARALVNEPAVVFLDEPTLGLDPAGQRQVLDLVRDIARRRGATVVLSTHMLHEVEEVCTSVLILGAGRVLKTGPMTEILRSVTVQHRGKLRVPVDRVDQARAALARVAGLTVEPSDGRPEVLTVSVTASPARRRERADDGMNAVLGAVLAAGVPILGFEVEGARLPAAFLAMTTEGVS